ncbi:hypothetical protein KCU89_g111, partial [Aureobasidium melanogenum]
MPMQYGLLLPLLSVISCRSELPDRGAVVFFRGSTSGTSLSQPRFLPDIGTTSASARSNLSLFCASAVSQYDIFQVVSTLPPSDLSTCCRSTLEQEEARLVSPRVRSRYPRLAL